MHLLATNIVAELARTPKGPLASRISALPSDECCINPIVACEIEYGLARRNSTRLRQQVEAILSAVSIVELPSDIAAHYGRIRVELERQGTPIGPYDLLIAAHCFASAITLVTGGAKFGNFPPGER